MLQQLSSDNQKVLPQLIPVLYGELRQLASSYLRRERANHTLQPTALVHEAYLRLVDQNVVQWKNRAHFFGVAAQLMRRILVDYARSHQAEKRGGDISKVCLEDAVIASKANGPDVLALHETLGRLAAIDQQQERIVELRVFAGLTIEEIAEVIGVSPATVKRDWSTGKAWLARELRKRDTARAARASI